MTNAFAKLPCICLPVERPSAIVESGASLLVVPDPLHTLELSDAPGKYQSVLSDIVHTFV